MRGPVPVPGGEMHGPVPVPGGELSGPVPVPGGELRGPVPVVLCNWTISAREHCECYSILAYALDKPSSKKKGHMPSILAQLGGLIFEEKIGHSLSCTILFKDPKFKILL